MNSESHACKENPDKIEDDELKDNIHEDAASGSSQYEIGILLYDHFLKDIEDGVCCL